MRIALYEIYFIKKSEVGNKNSFLDRVSDIDIYRYMYIKK